MCFHDAVLSMDGVAGRTWRSRNRESLHKHYVTMRQSPRASQLSWRGTGSSLAAREILGRITSGSIVSVSFSLTPKELVGEMLARSFYVARGRRPGLPSRERHFPIYLYERHKRESSSSLSCRPSERTEWDVPALKREEGTYQRTSSQLSAGVLLVFLRLLLHIVIP